MQFYLEIVDYILKKIAENQAVFKYYKVTVIYMPPASMTAESNDNDFIAKFCKFAEVYDKETIVLPKGLKTSILHILKVD